MQTIKELARELSKGNVKEASGIRMRVSAHDSELQGEVVEVARQAMFAHIKGGMVEVACEIRRAFDIPDELAHEATKQAVLSIYAEGNLRLMLDVERRAHLPRSLRQEIVDYCETWGRKEEAEAMRRVFLG